MIKLQEVKEKLEALMKKSFEIIFKGFIRSDHEAAIDKIFEKLKDEVFCFVLTEESLWKFVSNTIEDMSDQIDIEYCEEAFTSLMETSLEDLQKIDEERAEYFEKESDLEEAKFEFEDL